MHLSECCPGYFELFAKYGQPPGWRYGQWDFRQAYQYYQTQQDKDEEVKFDRDTEGFQTGACLYLPSQPAAFHTCLPTHLAPYCCSILTASLLFLMWRVHVCVSCCSKFARVVAMMLAGLWYAGVEGDDHADCKYTITINKYDCPLNCNGRGTCVHASNGSRTCNCDQVSWTGNPTQSLLTR